jgi:hypothetical protein
VLVPNAPTDGTVIGRCGHTFDMSEACSDDIESAQPSASTSEQRDGIPIGSRQQSELSGLERLPAAAGTMLACHRKIDLAAVTITEPQNRIATLFRQDEQAVKPR